MDDICRRRRYMLIRARYMRVYKISPLRLPRHCRYAMILHAMLLMLLALRHAVIFWRRDARGAGGAAAVAAGYARKWRLMPPLRYACCLPPLLRCARQGYAIRQREIPHTLDDAQQLLITLICAAPRYMMLR